MDWIRQLPRARARQCWSRQLRLLTSTATGSARAPFGSAANVYCHVGIVDAWLAHAAASWRRDDSFCQRLLLARRCSLVDSVRAGIVDEWYCSTRCGHGATHDVDCAPHDHSSICTRRLGRSLVRHSCTLLQHSRRQRCSIASSTHTVAAGIVKKVVSARLYPSSSTWQFHSGNSFATAIHTFTALTSGPA